MYDNLIRNARELYKIVGEPVEGSQGMSTVFVRDLIRRGSRREGQIFHSGRNQILGRVWKRNPMMINSYITRGAPLT